MSVCGWGGWSEQGRRPARRSGWNPFKSRAASLRRPGAASRSERASGSDASHLPACINRGQAPKYACRPQPMHSNSARRIFRCLTPIYARPGNRLQTDPADPDTTNIEMRSQSPNFRRVPTSSSQESDERPTRASRPRKRPWDIGRSPGSPLALPGGISSEIPIADHAGRRPARHPVASARGGNGAPCPAGQSTRPAINPAPSFFGQPVRAPSSRRRKCRPPDGIYGSATLIR